MDLYVKNKSMETVGIIDTASSVIWAERYDTPGDFEIYMPASDEVIDLLQEDFYVCRGDTDRCMIVKNFNLSTSDEQGNYFTATGKSLESILYRRIVWKQTSLYGKVEICIRRLIDENLINPEVPERKIANFKLGEIKGFPETMEMQVTGDNLGEVVSNICKSYGMGFKITMQDGYFVFDLYKGADRSYNQTKLPYVVFSPDFDNLIGSEYSYDSDNYKNVVLVAGEGEGLDRKTQAVGDASGLYRYELYSDARNASSNNGEIADAEYYKQLVEDGKATLAESQFVENFTGSVDYKSPYSYGIDYFMGDVVQVFNEYGMTATPRISEIIESEDENGYQLIPTFTYTGGA